MRSLSRYFWTAALVGAVTALGLALQGVLAGPDFVMLYMVSIGAAAVWFGRAPSLMASALSVLAYDFFFVPPRRTFAIAEEHYLLTFAMMFVVGIFTSGLTLRARKGKVEELRNALLSTVSHDLRTPLAAITGAATTLREGSAALTETQRRELHDTICQEAERMERLIRNLLDMTRVEAGALQIKREWVPLEEVVGSALTRLEQQLEGRPVRVVLPDDFPLVFVDPMLLEQVLVNLLENAAKHTPTGTPIDVHAAAATREVVVEIADRGPGLPANSEERLFEKFFRGAPAGVAGAGLGLAICRGMVHALHGALSAENRMGGGAIFRVRLPLPSDAPEVPAGGKLEERSA